MGANKLKPLDDQTLSDLLEVVKTTKESGANTQFNVIDELHADENAHTRILVSLLKVDHVRRSFLKMVRRNLQKMPDCEEKCPLPNDILSEEVINHTTSDEVKAFSQYVDAQIVHQTLNKADNLESVAIIIENKIKGAIDQDHQLERYISTIKDTYSIDQSRVIVLYLTLRGEKEVAEYSLSKSYKEKLYAYMPVSYLDHIIPWLENELSFSLEQIRDEPYLSSGITQYVHHLKGLIGERQNDGDIFDRNLLGCVQEILEKQGINPYLALSRVNFEIGCMLDSGILTSVGINKYTKPILRRWLRRQFYWHFNEVVSDDDNGTYIDSPKNYTLAMYNAYDGQPGDLLYVDFFFESGDVSQYTKCLETFKKNLDEEGADKINYWDELSYNDQKYIRVFVSSEEQLNIFLDALPSNSSQSNRIRSGMNSCSMIPYELEVLSKLGKLLTHHIEGLEEIVAIDYSDPLRTTHYVYRNNWAWQRSPWNGSGNEGAEIQIFPKKHGHEKDLIQFLANNADFFTPTRRFWWNGRVVIAFPLKDANYEKNLLRKLAEWKDRYGHEILEDISTGSCEIEANIFLHEDVVAELNKRVYGWTVDENSRCAYNVCGDQAMVKYIPPFGSKALPPDINIYCVFDNLKFYGCEIAAWQNDATCNANYMFSRENELSEWHFCRNDNWLAWKGIYGDQITDRDKDGYGMTWDDNFFRRIQNEPGFKKHMAKELADAILKLYEMLTE